eukprot:TRINITY_DN18094_c0_g1_i1.p1 TRINITY_DN18094_c0_g1~~TRINITY_DN18094_c0_g1_i1.p1  ORF type:complete len:678 (+),score=121.78 TRINITY_DN18094_c0_g1_i1:47-2035(+)
MAHATPFTDTLTVSSFEADVQSLSRISAPDAGLGKTSPTPSGSPRAPGGTIAALRASLFNVDELCRSLEAGSVGMPSAPASHCCCSSRRASPSPTHSRVAVAAAQGNWVPKEAMSPAQAAQRAVELARKSVPEPQTQTSSAGSPRPGGAADSFVERQQSWQASRVLAVQEASCLSEKAERAACKQARADPNSDRLLAAKQRRRGWETGFQHSGKQQITPEEHSFAPTISRRALASPRRDGPIADRLYIDAVQRRDRRLQTTATPPTPPFTPPQRPADAPASIRGSSAPSTQQESVRRLLRYGMEKRQKHEQLKAESDRVELERPRPTLSRRTEQWLRTGQRRPLYQCHPKGGQDSVRHGAVVFRRAASGSGGSAEPDTASCKPAAPRACSSRSQPPPQPVEFRGTVVVRSQMMAARRDARLERMRRALSEDAARECTFSPRLCAVSHRIVQRASASPPQPPSPSPQRCDEPPCVASPPHSGTCLSPPRLSPPRVPACDSADEMCSDGSSAGTATPTQRERRLAQSASSPRSPSPKAPRPRARPWPRSADGKTYAAAGLRRRAVGCEVVVEGQSSLSPVRRSSPPRLHPPLSPQAAVPSVHDSAPPPRAVPSSDTLTLATPGSMASSPRSAVVALLVEAAEREVRKLSPRRAAAPTQPFVTTA